ncbi:ABC transporter ATP-binding protein [Rhodopirellula sp.]|nr:ABC transporter ATP-binding protein [Rhodopirellula sp.]MDB4532876.1 ABC transporter ATP-binding protein [bacterium]MDB4770614.1 ABC transporter ATP-binding protein [bacterium]
MSDSNAVIQIDQLTKQYGEFTALDALSMQVEQGQIMGFIGPNGAGKTTTIKILVGLLKPTSGRATIAGADCLAESRKIKKLVGYMPDDFGKYNNMRVNEYLDFFGAVYGISRRPRLRRVDEVLEIAGATYMKDLFVDALSRGMQQRVALARTMMHDPEVLILDEPANGLDPQARIDMRTLLLKLSDMGKTLIVTSHILPELARVCDVVAMITKGKLRAFGTVDSIMKDIQQRRTFEIQLLDRSRVGSATASVQSWLDGHIDQEKGGVGKATGAEAEQMVRFNTSLSDDAIAPLLAHLVHQKEPVSQFREVATDLEDAFLHVANEENDSDSTPESAEVSAS